MFFNWPGCSMNENFDAYYNKTPLFSNSIGFCKRFSLAWLFHCKRLKNPIANALISEGNPKKCFF